MPYSSVRNRHTPYAYRVEYAGHGRHHAKAARRPGAWLASKWRDLGDALFGAFVAVA